MMFVFLLLFLSACQKKNDDSTKDANPSQPKPSLRLPSDDDDPGLDDFNNDDESSDNNHGYEFDNPVVYSEEELAQVAEFQKQSSELSLDDIPSALELLRIFKSLATEGATNDALFIEYEETMQSISESLNETIMDDPPDEETISAAIENGFLLIDEADYSHYILRPDFFCDTFSPYVSTPIKDMLELRKKHYYFADEHDFIENSTLMVTLDQLAEMIIDWENYLKQYVDTVKITDIAYNLDYYLKVYVGSNQIENSGFYVDMGVDENGDIILALADEPKQSYMRFIENFPDSLYHPIISELYQIYKDNNFLYTVKIETFFVEKELDVPYW